jgi:DNA-directed RNA polymerase specialized sigma24 family protein
MADANQKARRVVRAAQAKFEREQDAAHKARRQAFAEAQKAGLTLREIADEIGLHHTRVSQIIRGE